MFWCIAKPSGPEFSHQVVVPTNSTSRNDHCLSRKFELAQDGSGGTLSPLSVIWRQDLATNTGDRAASSHQLGDSMAIEQLNLPHAQSFADPVGEWF